MSLLLGIVTILGLNPYELHSMYDVRFVWVFVFMRHCAERLLCEERVFMEEKKNDFQPSAAGDGERSAFILAGVGGSGNVLGIDCCATRLRLSLADIGRVNETLLKKAGALGVIFRGNAVQVVYGPSVLRIKSDFEKLVERIRSGEACEADLIKSM